MEKKYQLECFFSRFYKQEKSDFFVFSHVWKEWKKSAGKFLLVWNKWKEKSSSSSSQGRLRGVSGSPFLAEVWST